MQKPKMPILRPHPEGYPKEVTPSPDFFLMQRIRVMAMVRLFASAARKGAGFRTGRFGCVPSYAWRLDG